jgi:hypothetical protein
MGNRRRPVSRFDRRHLKHASRENVVRLARYVGMQVRHPLECKCGCHAKLVEKLVRKLDVEVR